MPRFASSSLAPKPIRALATLASAAILAMALSSAASAPAPALDSAVAKDGIPNLASVQFAWLSDGADWMDPPAGTPGHGRITNDPDHPFIGNVDAIRSGRTPTLRIGNAKDPVLKPWAAKLMADSNLAARPHGAPHLHDRQAFVQSQAAIVRRIHRPLRGRQHARRRHHRSCDQEQLHRQFPHAAYG